MTTTKAFAGMTEEKRTGPRIKASFQVEMTHPTKGTIRTRTRDISDGGAFVIVNNEFMPDLNMKVSIRVLGLPGESPAPVPSEVVRVEAEGVGVKFVEDDEGKARGELDDEDLAFLNDDVLEEEIELELLPVQDDEDNDDITAEDYDTLR